MIWQYKSSILAVTLGLAVLAVPALCKSKHHHADKNAPFDQGSLTVEGDAMRRRSEIALSLGGGKKKKNKEKEQQVAPTPPPAPKEPPKPENPPSTSELAPKMPAPTAVTDTPPPMIPDAALVSILKDISKSLKETPDVAKVEEPCQKAAMAMSQEALEKALGRSEYATNRILDGKQKTLAESWVRPESWESGEITLGNNCKASLNAVWAKKIDGSVNLSIAGNCGCSPLSDGTRLGEWVFLLNGKSTVDKGFDIQSQSEVTFWLGKVTNVSIDAGCCATGTTAPVEGSRPQGATIVLKALATDRTRQYDYSVAKFNKAIQNIKDQAEAQAKAEAEAKAKAEAEEKRKQEEAAAEAEAKKAAAEKAAAEKAVAEARARDQAGTPSDGGATGAGGVPNGTEIAMGTPPGGRPASTAGTRMPSPSAQMLLPEKAVAGQYMTVAVLNPNHAGESLVQLTFNGSAIATGEDGKALFMVPPESIPGPTLQVAMPARQDSMPLTVTVLQPLETPSMPQIPRVDVVSRLVQARGTLTIDGHNFDGFADRNRVIIDGVYDARVLVASPVELKADIPGDLIPGPHTVTISTNGLRSNPGQFDVANAELQADPKEAAKDVMSKLVLRVNGSKDAMRVRVKNLSPDVIKLGKSNEFVVTTPGGPNNSVTLPAQRLRKAPYHVQLVLE